MGSSPMGSRSALVSPPQEETKREKKTKGDAQRDRRRQREKETKIDRRRQR